MIKINLVKTKVGGADAVDVSDDFKSPSNSKTQLTALFKIVLMVIFVLGAKFYRDDYISKLKNDSNVLRQRMTDIQAEIDRKRQEAGAKPGIEEEARAINNKLEIIRNLSRLRLVEVKSLDFIQSIIPERVWLTSINYTDSNFKISGFSTNEEDVNRFLSDLENSPYFSDVILTQSQEADNREGVRRSFEVTFHAEIKN